MPTYEYACDKCGNNFEVVQKMSDSPIEVCPKCGKKVRKVLSGGIAISFKGSGFYVNDAGGKTESSGKKESTGKTSTPAPVAPACTGCSEK